MKLCLCVLVGMRMQDIVNDYAGLGKILNWRCEYGIMVRILIKFRSFLGLKYLLCFKQFFLIKSVNFLFFRGLSKYCICLVEFCCVFRL
jgi:hypothetical protein